MTLVKLICKAARYKTIRFFLLLIAILAISANVLLVFSNGGFQFLLPVQTRVMDPGIPGQVVYETMTPLEPSIPGNAAIRNLGDAIPQRLQPRGLSEELPFNTEDTVAINHRTTEGTPTGDTSPGNDCESWCHHGKHLSPPYNLTAVLLVRIYRHDLAGLTSREMLQWLYYLRYAGFDHVFVYDAYVMKNESQYHVLMPLIQSGYVTYIDWSRHNPYTIEGTQIASYQDSVDKHGHKTTWQAAMDIDEYPFSPVDLEPNFMSRFLAKYSAKHPDVSQITLANYLFLGKPLDHLNHPFLIDRIRRRTHKPANQLGKSVYKTADIKAAQVHHNDMRKGRSVDCDSRVLRMNHYWGARLQNWGEDKPEILNITEPDFSIQPILNRITGCAKCLGEDSLYVRRWN